MSNVSASRTRHRHHGQSRGPHRPSPPPSASAGLFDGLRRVLDTLEQSTLPRPPVAIPAGHEHGGGSDCGCGGDCGCGRKGGDCGCGHDGGHDGSHGSHHKGQRTEECGCKDTCSEDSCACTCCVSDADLVVYARVGERRVVPLTVVNERRRERDVELDLSEFRTAGGRAAPVAGAVTPSKMSLAPCQEEQAILLINITASDVEGDQDRGATDVDDCVTAYADLRLTGCDTRPIRIAVVILPRVCNVYRVRCGLGCC